MDREPTFPPRVWMPALLLVAGVLWWTGDGGEAPDAGEADPPVAAGATADPAAPAPAPDPPPDPPPDQAPVHGPPLEGEGWLWDWESLRTAERVQMLERDRFLVQAVALREELAGVPECRRACRWFSGSRFAPFVWFQAESGIDPAMRALMDALLAREARLKERYPELIIEDPEPRPFGLVRGAADEAGRAMHLEFRTCSAGDVIVVPEGAPAPEVATELLARQLSRLTQGQHGVTLPWWLLVGMAEAAAAEDLSALWRRGGRMELDSVLQVIRPEDLERQALAQGDLVREWVVHQEFRASAGSFVAWLQSGADGQQPSLIQALHEALRVLVQSPGATAEGGVDLWVRITGHADLAGLQQSWRAGQPAADAAVRRSP